LLDQFVDDRHHGGIVKHHAFINLFLLGCGQQQADRAQSLAVSGAHGVFHVFRDLLFECHGRCSL
jgi:hypothetical protein